MYRLATVILTVFLLLLGGCLPRVSPNQSATNKLLVFPGGWIDGRWVHLAEDVYSLPATPRDADANGKVIGVIYAYSWQRYLTGQLDYEATLPYPAVSLHARPAWVVVLERGLYTEASGWLDYPALDAVNTKMGLFWVNDEGLWQGAQQLVEGRFRRVLALENRILALSQESGVYWPGEEVINLPSDWSAADAAADLYLLTPTGLLRYDPAGYELGFYPGSFSDLAVAENGDVWLATDDGRVVHLTAELEEAW